MDAVSLMSWFPAGARTRSMPGTPVKDSICLSKDPIHRVDRTGSLSSEDESSTCSCSETANRPRGRWNSITNLRRTHLLAKYLPVSACPKGQPSFNGKTLKYREFLENRNINDTNGHAIMLVNIMMRDLCRKKCLTS